MMMKTVVEKEMWFLIVVTLCIALLVKTCVDIFMGKKNKRNSSLPPNNKGPLISTFRVPIIGSLLWLQKSTSEVEATLRSLRSSWAGTNIPKVPAAAAITSRFLFGRPLIFVFSRSLAHRALVDNGAMFADRPKPSTIDQILSSNQHSINTAGYGDMWRILRRNLSSQILNPSRFKSFSHARSWVLGILIDRLVMKSEASCGGEEAAAVRVVDHFRYAMFCLLVLMCFGDKLGEEEIKKIESVQHGLLASVRYFQPLNLRPTWLTKVLFSGRWKKFFEMKMRQESVIIPYIRRKRDSSKVDSTVSYLDSLLQLEVPDDDDASTVASITSTDSLTSSSTSRKNTRKLTEEELVSACSEFLNAGTDTTTTALQWIMANLVKNPHIQTKLYEEINNATALGKLAVEEEDLSKMVYLKAVVLEGLRRHPPNHFLLPHAVTQDVQVDGVLFPKNSTINFMVADIGWDVEVWDDPMQFNPERFLPYLLSTSSKNGTQFDITGTRDIKMMPFGAGRRICPALNLAILHLEYFIANMIRRFEWREVDGYEVDLSEEQEFTIVMKYPLHTRIVPRIRD